MKRHERSSKGTYYLKVDKRTEMLVLALFPLPTTPTFLKLSGQQVTAPPGTQCTCLGQDHQELVCQETQPSTVFPDQLWGTWKVGFTEVFFNILYK